MALMLQPRNRSIQSEIKRKIEELEQQEMDEKNNLKNLKTIGRTRLQVPAELRTGTCMHLPREVCEQNRSALRGPRLEGPTIQSRPIFGQFLALSAINDTY